MRATKITASTGLSNCHQNNMATKEASRATVSLFVISLVPYLKHKKKISRIKISPTANPYAPKLPLPFNMANTAVP